MEALVWVCKGSKDNTIKAFENLRDEIKDQYPSWGGIIGGQGDDNHFIIFVEYESLRDEDKESVAIKFTDLVASLDIDLIH